MNSTSWYFAFGMIVMVFIAAWIIGAYIKDTKHRRDNDAPPVRVKHRFLANPIVWMYILFPIAVAVGVWLIYVVL